VSAAFGSSGPGATGGAQSPAGAQQDSALWAVLASANDSREYCQSWLAIQCRLIPAVVGGVVLLRLEGAEGYSAVAVWPDVRRDMSYLTPTAQQALVERRGVVAPGKPAREGAPANTFIGYPVEAAGRLHGVVVLDIAPRPDAELQAALRQLHWGAAGLELMFCQQEVARAGETRDRLQTVLEVVAAAAAHDRFVAAGTALATDLASRLKCDRVTVGFVHGGQIRIEAVSHSAQFKERTNLMRAIATAMDEAVDQQATVAVPPPPGSSPLVRRAHDALVDEHGSGACCTVVMTSLGKPVGAITLERVANRPFDPPTIELCEAVAALGGPILEVHRREDRWFGARIADWWRERLRQLFGPRHAGLKLGVSSAVVLLAFMLFAQGDFRVSASTVLEPQLQLAATAPFNGYIKEAPVRAGDLVKQGALLARLDDRDLKIERLKWLSQQEELSKSLRSAFADRNLAQVQIVTAQLEQARAQVARVEEQLARTTVAAPFDGVVVSGDLSQSLGAPVERGTILFEVAPLSEFRLVLKVDEGDVAYVEAGQRGTLLLSAFPNDPIGFEVTKVTPVSTPREGKNFFRVEAKLDRTDPRMRPNMEGVGKVEIDRRSYLWIWTRHAVNSLRLILWSWLP
jgi:pyruvate/2-oxoglutarate dehydrogenase complex dihydrolipoamide acyltransferase (E2) component